jgi:hypothetical protein
MIPVRTRFIAILIGLVMPIASSATITVGVDKLAVVHKSSNGVTIAFPDVCKTPTPGGPIAIPYPNTVKSADTAKGSKRTKVSATEKPAEKARQSGLASAKSVKNNDVVFYNLEVKTEGRLHIRQPAGKDSVTTATYIDGKGNKMPLRDHALIKLSNGDLCAICATGDGRVTAVYRLLPNTPKRKTP